MSDNTLLEIVRKLSSTAGRLQGKVVLMGGMALSVYAPPRATFDIDAIGDFEDEQLNRFLNDLKEQGFLFDEKSPVKEIAGLKLVTLYYPRAKIYVDLFIARSEFQKLTVQRSRSFRIRGFKLDILSPEDLILFKLLGYRPRDIDDIRQILKENADNLDFPYLRHWADKMGKQIFLEDEIKSLGFHSTD